jgi:dsDNA-specific endonuclease/ATPase MutS2
VDIRDEDDVYDSDEPVVVPIEDSIDLHTFLPRDVKAIVEEYLEEAHKRGFTSVRIIHGKGKGVQKEIVRSILSKNDYVKSFADADAILGGLGATIAVLRYN